MTRTCSPVPGFMLIPAQVRSGTEFHGPRGLAVSPKRPRFGGLPLAPQRAFFHTLCADKGSKTRREPSLRVPYPKPESTPLPHPPQNKGTTGSVKAAPKTHCKLLLTKKPPPHCLRSPQNDHLRPRIRNRRGSAWISRSTVLAWWRLCSNTNSSQGREKKSANLRPSAPLERKTGHVLWLYIAYVLLTHLHRAILTPPTPNVCRQPSLRSMDPCKWVF